MESASTWEYKKLIDELTRGMENATRLRFHLLSTSPSEAQDLLVQVIVETFENALSILKWDGPVGGALADAPIPAPPDSSISADASPKSEDMNTISNRDTPKKRKMQTTWAEQVRVSCENGLEGPKDDGCSWRKYGQKDILGAKHPRSYYRCTYRQAQSCWATKQVQRSDEDPTVFDITYKGTHTCNNQPGNAVSPEKQELGENHIENSRIMRVPPDFSFPSTFPRAEGEYSYFSIPTMHPPLSCTTASTSESNYLSAVTGQMMSYVGPPMQHSETEIVSGHQSSTTHSPIGGMELSIDLDPDFPFNIPSFFTC